MLPKPEKNKKLTESVSDEQKTSHKRLIIILIISVTIGLSLIFWIYRFVKTNTFFSSKSASSAVPSFAYSPEKNLKKILKSNYSQWSFTIQTNSSPPLFWTSKPNVNSPIDFPPLASTIEQLKQPLDSFVTETLPRGLTIFQHSSSNRHQFIITTPQDQIYLDINYPDNTDLSLIKDILFELYWSSVIY